jgi:hypothetical protein
MRLPKRAQFATSIKTALEERKPAMRRIFTTALLLTLPLIHACSGGKSEDSKVTQTRMDDIDNVEGTISDDMINTDESTETGPLDATPVEPAKKPADKAEKNDQAPKTEAKSDTPAKAPDAAE